MSKRTHGRNGPGRPVTRRTILKTAGAAAIGAVAAPAILSRRAKAADELNVLTWCDHLDPKLIGPFEEAHGVRVNLKDYEGTGSALAIYETSQPGEWDVFIVNSNDVPEISKGNIFAELPEHVINWDNIFPEIHQRQFHYKDDKLIAVPEKFGYQGLAFNRTAVDPEDMRHWSVLWDPKYKGRIAIFDWYQPFIQGLVVANGVKPTDMTLKDLDPVREQLMKIKPNVALISDVVTCQTAIATGDVDIIGGGAEWMVSQLMATEKPELDWVVPDEGGIRWMQAVTVFDNSTRKDLALEFVKYILSDDGQARLATSECYWAMPSSKTAALTDEQKKILRWDEQSKFLANTHYDIRHPPELDQAQIDLWTEFLQA